MLSQELKKTESSKLHYACIGTWFVPERNIQPVHVQRTLLLLLLLLLLLKAQVYTPPVFFGKIFGLICFLRICFRGLIYSDQEPLWLLNVIEDVCYFFGVHIRLSARCKMFHSKITWPFRQKSHECALKLTDLWNTSLLF